MALPVELCSNSLSRCAWRAADDRDGPHRHANGKQTRDDSVNRRIQLFIRWFRTIECPISFLAHAQAEEVRLGYNKIQILVVNLCNILLGIRLRNLPGKVFKERSGNGGKEVDVGWCV